MLMREQGGILTTKGGSGITEKGGPGESAMVVEKQGVGKDILQLWGERGENLINQGTEGCPR